MAKIMIFRYPRSLFEIPKFDWVIKSPKVDQIVSLASYSSMDYWYIIHALGVIIYYLLLCVRMYVHSKNIYYKEKTTKTRQTRPKQSDENTQYTTRQKWSKQDKNNQNKVTKTQDYTN